MNVFINTMYLEYSSTEGVEKRFPMIYFWLKDYYYQRSAGNFSKVNWSFNDNPTPIRQNKKLQQQLFDNPPDIVGLSMYMWNEQVLLDNAKWLKENFPHCIIIGGGPNADSRQAFMSQHTYIDAVVPGPAAETFKRIIDKRLDDKSIKDIAGVCYWDGKEVVRNKPVPRNEDPLVLDYVNNFYDEVKALMDEYTKNYNTVVWTTMYIQGCPYSCSFCEQGTSLWTKIHKRDIKKFYSEVDLLAQYNNCVLEFADANFGIVPEYEDILDYVIEKGKGKLTFNKPPLAKNQVEFTSYLMKKMIDSGVYNEDYSFGKITLQDPNPDIVKFNGRPFSKEYEKIKNYQEFTKDAEHKTGRVEIIMGMPGQTYKTLTDSLHELLKNDLLSHHLPYWYLIFPNTVLTSPGSEYRFKDQKVYVRSERHYAKSLLDHADSDSGLYFNHMIETETLTTAELTASWYHWTLMCHLFGFLGWMRTPINYLKNYHGVDSHSFIQKYTEQFHPSNWSQLPESYRLDLEQFERWLLGKDKLYQRYDNSNKYAINPRRVSQHRFHANPEDFMIILEKIFNELIDIENDPNIKNLFAWQKAKILPFDEGDKKRTHKTINYNFDDIALCKDTSYYKSIWQFEWPKENLYGQTLSLDMIKFVPDVNWTEISDESLQKELVITPYKMIA